MERMDNYGIFLTRFGIRDSALARLEYDKLAREGVDPAYDDVFVYERNGRYVAAVGYHYKRKKCNPYIKSVTFDFLAENQNVWNEAFSGDFAALKACRCTIVDINDRVFKKIVFTADLNTRNPAKFTMLMKTAESQCMSLAFPNVLNGMHTDVEIKTYGVDEIREQNLKKFKLVAELVERFGVNDEFKEQAVKLLKNGVEKERVAKIAERYLKRIKNPLNEIGVWNELLEGNESNAMNNVVLQVAAETFFDEPCDADEQHDGFVERTDGDAEPSPENEVEP